MGDAGPSTPISVLSDTPGINTPSSVTENVRDIHVLVTGFGPFKSFTNNPSWLIASALPKTLEPELDIDEKTLKSRTSTISTTGRIRPARPGPYRIHVHVYPSPVRVAYASTATFIPSVLDARTNLFHINFDYVLHIGLASGRDTYTLETIAHRDYYKIKDVDEGDGYMAGESIWKRESIPEKLEVGWDSGDVLRRWEAMVQESEERYLSELLASKSPGTSSLLRQGQQGTTGPTGWRSNNQAYSIGGRFPFTAASTLLAPHLQRSPVVKLSRDAGRFLCEFIMMCSLVDRWRDANQQSRSEDQSDREEEEGKQQEDPCEKVGKVMFLHVPNGTDNVDVERGRRVAESAIRAVVGSWEDGWRNTNVYAPEGLKMMADPDHVSKHGGFETKGTGDA